MDSYSKLFVETGSRSFRRPSFVKAYKQYRYTADRQEFLDLITHVAHVGHSHPLVVSAGQEQVKKLSAGQGFYSIPLQEFTKTLLTVLPVSLKQHFLVNSGSEANDLALRMARTYTGGDDFIVFDGAYHGSFSRLLDLSPAAANLLNLPLPATTHVVSPPDLYGGRYTDQHAGDRYVEEVVDAIAAIERRGGKLAAFISEPIALACGVILPPTDYYRRVYELVRAAGGVVVADETGCGLGRAGEHFWTFEHFGVVPDIVTVGKSLGNGFPTALVITTKDIADHLGDHFSTFGGNPVSCRVAGAVLDVIHGEMMRASARSIGKFLLEELRRIQRRHEGVVGEVRGRGLCVGVAIVTDQRTRRPNPRLAMAIQDGLLQKGFLVSSGGEGGSVLILTPPACITQRDARLFTTAFDYVLDQLLLAPQDDLSNGLKAVKTEDEAELPSGSVTDRGSLTSITVTRTAVTAAVSARAAAVTAPVNVTTPAAVTALATPVTDGAAAVTVCAAAVTPAGAAVTARAAAVTSAGPVAVTAVASNRKKRLPVSTVSQSDPDILSIPSFPSVRSACSKQIPASSKSKNNSPALSASSKKLPSASASDNQLPASSASCQIISVPLSSVHSSAPSSSRRLFPCTEAGSQVLFGKNVPVSSRSQKLSSGSSSTSSRTIMLSQSGGELAGRSPAAGRPSVSSNTADVVTATSRVADVSAASKKAGMPAISSALSTPAASSTAGVPASLSTAGVSASFSAAGVLASLSTAGIHASSSAAGVLASLSTAGVSASLSTAGVSASSRAAGVHASSSAASVRTTSSAAAVPATSSAAASSGVDTSLNTGTVRPLSPDVQRPQQSKRKRLPQPGDH